MGCFLVLFCFCFLVVVLLHFNATHLEVMVDIIYRHMVCWSQHLQFWLLALGLLVSASSVLVAIPS